MPPSAFEECAFTTAQCDRFGRQMILPQIGPEGMKKLLSSKVLVIGAGGLGSPICLYLAAAGIGTLGIMDGDTVATSNLHRQIIHNDETVNVNKAQSAAIACRKINPLVQLNIYDRHLHNQEALSLFLQYDVIVDATDNAAARYLINDTSVLAKKPNVSGSSLRWEGQLAVYNYQGGPCYRCIFPYPPPNPDTGACDKHGVIGTGPGLIGVMQSTEVLKILTGNESGVLKRLLIYDALNGETPFRHIKLRPRSLKCDVCGDSPGITDVKDFDYESFSPTCVVPPAMTEEESISADAFIQEHVIRNNEDVIIGSGNACMIDVRPKGQFLCAHIPGTIHMALSDVYLMKTWEEVKSSFKLQSDNDKIIFICRRGNDSRFALRFIQQTFPESNSHEMLNLTGGILAMSKINPNIPVV